jgi:hypothetical protein
MPKKERTMAFRCQKAIYFNDDDEYPGIIRK